MNVPNLTLNNGVAMPQLGLGVWQASDDEAEFAVATALEAGYRLVDTAAIYGNEAGVGRALASTDVPREEIFITTKVWNEDQGYDATLDAFDRSLDKLGLDYLDLYLIHWPVPSRGLAADTWKALERLYRDERVRAIGVCNFRIEDLDQLLEGCSVPPAVNQIELHPDFAQMELRDYCRERNIAVESWSPIGGKGDRGGLLTNSIVAELAERYGKTPAQIVIRWHIDSGLIVIPKSVHAERIRENINVFDFALTGDDMARLATLDGGQRLGGDPATVGSA